jgi:16S rRNA C967 or C1407 C5-methylase (RsmB/RsmF family)
MALLVLSMIEACGPSVPAIDLRESRLATLKSITQRCGLPEDSLQLSGTDDLHVRPPVDAKYESVDCALAELKKANMPLKMGFVGNEVYANESQ